MTKMLLTAAAAAAFSLAAFGAPALAQDDREALIQAALAAPDRTPEELDRDHRRRPAASLGASPVQPGDRVLDLSSGPGYMARLYAALVGPDGHVTAQNAPPPADAPPEAQQRAAGLAATFEAMNEARGNVDLMMAPAGALTAEDGSYDVVAITLSYHDRERAGDATAMNAEAFRVLRPGGHYFVVDHNAPAGTGAAHVTDLHRIDKAYVIEQVEAAGFELESESAALENPDDPLTGGNRDDAGSSQFALTFVKPAS